MPVPGGADVGIEPTPCADRAGGEPLETHGYGGERRRPEVGK